MWEGAEHFIRQMALSNLPLGLMCVGAALQFNGLQRDVFALALNVFGRLLFMPALAWLICHSLNIPSFGITNFSLIFCFTYRICGLCTYTSFRGR